MTTTERHDAIVRGLSRDVWRASWRAARRRMHSAASDELVLAATVDELGRALTRIEQSFGMACWLARHYDSEREVAIRTRTRRAYVLADLQHARRQERELEQQFTDHEGATND